MLQARSATTRCSQGFLAVFQGRLKLHVQSQLLSKDAGSVVAGRSSTLLLRQQPTQDF